MRYARVKSITGVYHVMFRGINRQDLFLDEQDYRKMADTLLQIVMPMDENGNMLPSKCFIYAWCFMSNHVHLLIQEKGEPISDILKRLEVSYALYYNKKYGRESTLFHDRFRSEPCDDYNYFLRLLRYIHRNPINAGLTETIEQYKWSSWHELTSEYPLYYTIVDVGLVHRQLRKYGNTLQYLIEFVNNPEEDYGKFIDMPECHYRKGVTDDEVWQEIERQSEATDPTSFQKLDRKTQKELFAILKRKGAQIKQLQRLTGIGRNIIQRS